MTFLFTIGYIFFSWGGGEGGGEGEGRGWGERGGAGRPGEITPSGA